MKKYHNAYLFKYVSRFYFFPKMPSHSSRSDYSAILDNYALAQAQMQVSNFHLSNRIKQIDKASCESVPEAAENIAGDVDPATVQPLNPWSSAHKNGDWNHLASHGGNHHQPYFHEGFAQAHYSGGMPNASSKNYWP